MTYEGCIKQQIWLVCLFMCLLGFVLLEEKKIQLFQLTAGCGSVYLEVWFQIRVEVWEGSCVKELWGVHQIDAEHSVPHSSFRQWLSRAWKAATDMVVIAHIDSCSHERKNISGKINETLQILLSFYEYIVLNLQVWRNSPECRKVREVTY